MPAQKLYRSIDRERPVLKIIKPTKGLFLSLRKGPAIGSLEGFMRPTMLQALKGLEELYIGSFRGAVVPT